MTAPARMGDRPRAGDAGEDFMTTMNRRGFLEATAAASALAALRPRSATAGGHPKKAVLLSMLPTEPSYRERFQMALDAGFAGIEIGTVADAAEAEKIRAASDATGLLIHSVMETSLRNAKLWGAGTVLLVPAVVNPETSYQQAWTRSQTVVRERILPLAQELEVIVAMEEVWNKFLLSPLEMARYVDEFASPWVKAYVDVGNMIFYGYPQDWIRTLGPRVVRIHLKDFKLDRQQGRFYWKNLGEGDVDWVAVRQALSDIDYDAWMTTEIEGGDAAYLEDVVARIDRFLAGQKPV
jgi:L-ribulose-5-phosphate 3-epimerase